MKLNFKLGIIGSFVMSIMTLLSLAIAALFTNEITVVIAAVITFAFWTCSKSNAFSNSPSVSWLVAITSIIVSIALIGFMILIILLLWLLHIIFKTPSPHMPRLFK